MTTLGLNLRPLANSGYLEMQDSKLGYHRFLLADNTTESSIKAASDAIRELLQENQFLTLLEPAQSLTASVLGKRYLIINKGAICLTNETPAAPLFRTNEIDSFCKTILREPVSCERGHTFEKERIEQWVAQRGYACPHNRNHNIGEIAIDEDILENVERAKQAFDAEELERKSNKDSLDELRNRNAATERELSLAKTQLEMLKQKGAIQSYLDKGRFLVSNANLKETTWKGVELCAGVGKIVLKVSKISLKVIPFVSLISGVAMSATRLIRGEGWKKATAEIASGVAGCFPGIGTVISVVIDGSLMLLDGKELKEKWDPADLDYKKAAELFGFDPEEAISVKEIESTYRKLSQCTHPDRVKTHGSATEKEFAAIQVQVNKAKEILLAHVARQNPATPMDVDDVDDTDT